MGEDCLHKPEGLKITRIFTKVVENKDDNSQKQKIQSSTDWIF